MISTVMLSFMMDSFGDVLINNSGEVVDPSGWKVCTPSWEGVRRGARCGRAATIDRCS
ncbi:hypothetical protein [Mycolicibacterium sp. A43C]